MNTDQFPQPPAVSSAGRNVALLVLQRGLIVAAGVIFASIVPRMMGPEMYGRYSLVTALAVFLALLSGLGLTNAIGRYVPEFLHRGEAAEVRRFLGGLLTVRLFSSVAAALVYLGITVGWLREVDSVILMTMAGVVLAQGIAQYLFSVFLGFDRAASWGMADVLRRWLALGLVVPGFLMAGLRGATIALLVTELILVCLGVWRGRFRPSLVDLRISPSALAPYLRFGLLFFANAALLTACQASGEPLVRLVSGSYAEVSYFALANNIFLAAAAAVSQVSLALLPLLTRLVTAGKADVATRLVDRMLTLFTIASVIALFAAVLLGDILVQTVIGPAFAAAAVNLMPLMLTLMMLGVSSVTVLLAIVYEQPNIALRASIVRLIGFWIVGPVCVARWGSFGACIAVLAASSAHAILSTFGLRDALGSSIRSAAAAAGTAALFLPILWLRSTPLVNLLLFGGFVVGYAAVLLATRVITTEEIRLVLPLVRAEPAADRAHRPRKR